MTTTKTTYTTVSDGQKLEIKGTRWGHHYVFTMKGYHAKELASAKKNPNFKVRPIEEATGPWVALSAEAYCIHNGPYVPENRVEVSVGEIIRIEGHGLWKIEQPGWAGGDSCKIVPMCKVAKKYAAKEKKFTPPAYVDMGNGKSISWERWMSE